MRMRQVRIVAGLTMCVGLLFVAVGCGNMNQTKLMSAARLGDVGEIRSELKMHAPVEAGDHEGCTALHAAAKHNQVEAIQVLVKEGHARVDAKDKDGQTPLHLACKKGHFEAADALVKLGANVNAKDADSWTALHFAARQGSLEIVQLLVAKGANTNVIAREEDDRFTARDVAEDEGHYDIADFLEEKGAKEVTHRNRD
jgi:ankyrin repeat protein